MCTMMHMLSTGIVPKNCVLLTILLCYIQLVNSSAAGQETLIGVVGRDFIMLGADSSLSSSITVTTSNVDKLNVLVDPFPNQSRCGMGHSNEYEQQAVIVASAGDAADGDRLFSLLKFHTSVMEFEASVGCDVKCLYHGDGDCQQRRKRGEQRVRSFSPDASSSSSGIEVDDVARLARGEIASSLRSTGRFNTCLLVAGMARCPEFPAVDTGSSVFDKRTESDTLSFSHRIKKQVEAAEKVYGGSDKNNKGKGLGTSSKYLHQKCNNKSYMQNPMLQDCINDSIAFQPRLYWIDEYGSIQLLEYGAHGLGANFALSILDRGYNPDLSKKEAADLIKDCFQQLKTRFVINCPTQPCVKCIDKDGCHLV